jgi:hypothetical protein
MHPMKPTGRSARRRTSAPTVSRLDGSAHCRSSRPSTTGPASAISSTKSVNASTTRNRSPGSLVTVIGPSSPSAESAKSAAMAARCGSGDDRAHPSVAASTPNGRVRSSSSARPAATRMPRLAASSSAFASRRVLPIPASPSTSTIAGPPAATRSRASPMAWISASRPQILGTGASVPMTGCYSGPAGACPRSQP